MISFPLLDKFKNSYSDLERAKLKILGKEFKFSIKSNSNNFIIEDSYGISFIIVPVINYVSSSNEFNIHRNQVLPLSSFFDIDLNELERISDILYRLNYFYFIVIDNEIKTVFIFNFSNDILLESSYTITNNEIFIRFRNSRGYDCDLVFSIEKGFFIYLESNNSKVNIYNRLPFNM